MLQGLRLGQPLRLVQVTQLDVQPLRVGVDGPRRAEGLRRHASDSAEGASRLPDRHGRRPDAQGSRVVRGADDGSPARETTGRRRAAPQEFKDHDAALTPRAGPKRVSDPVCGSRPLA
ncbi:hypothetical protein GCM10023088_15100 [Actinomadura verrucosospora]